MGNTERRLAAAMTVVAATAFVATLLGIGARATYGARVTADEPQYLLTAISLGEDASLDVSDELADERFRAFHEVDLNPQTIDLDDRGRRVSPHDPLLPLALAVPVRLGGWVGAKLTLAACAAAVAALTLRLAVTRLQAPLGPAAVVVGGFAIAPPFAVYGVQVYPAMPAALCVVGGVLAVTAEPSVSSSGRARIEVATAAAVIALPWLSVKYVPVAAVIAAAGVWGTWRRDRRFPLGVVVVYALAGVGYLALHRWWYGGWTVYAAGDHFVDGEWLVVGSDPDYLGRTRRLIGLLVDRGFGLAAWNPAFLALPPALVGLWRSRGNHRWVVLATIGAGWATATWVALTMHGWWWPGRQVVPVLPLAVAAIASLVGRSRAALAAVVAGAGLGSLSWLILAWEASTGRRTLIVDFEQTINPWYRVWRILLPDHRRMATTDVALTALWVVVLAAACIAVVVAERRATARAGAAKVPTEQPASTPT